jgi:hypothetical protein
MSSSSELNSENPDVNVWENTSRSPPGWLEFYFVLFLTVSPGMRLELKRIDINKACILTSRGLDVPTVTTAILIQIA